MLLPTWKTFFFHVMSCDRFLSYRSACEQLIWHKSNIKTVSACSMSAELGALKGRRQKKYRWSTAGAAQQAPPAEAVPCSPRWVNQSRAVLLSLPAQWSAQGRPKTLGPRTRQGLPVETDSSRWFLACITGSQLRTPHTALMYLPNTQQ